MKILLVAIGSGLGGVLRLIESSQWPSAVVYASLSILAGLTAVFFGYWISKGV